MACPLTEERLQKYRASEARWERYFHDRKAQRSDNGANSNPYVAILSLEAVGEAIGPMTGPLARAKEKSRQER
jgi:hypothetical protein